MFMNLFRVFFPQKNPDYIKEKYNIPNKINWDIELNNHGLIATSKDIPGLITNGRNPEELLEMINDAVLEYFDVPKIESDYVFNAMNLNGTGVVYLKQADKKRLYA